MPYIEADSASGSFVTDAGATVTYTTTSNETFGEGTFPLTPLFGPWIGDNDGNETHTHTFSEEIAGFRIEIDSITNTIVGSEELNFILDGVAVDLNVLIASGEATFVPNAAGTITPGGGVGALSGQDNGGGLLTFNIPVQTIEIVSTGSGFPGGTIYRLDADTSLICFAAGTLIDTQKGKVPIEQLEVGDRVLTVDAGYQSIRWIGSRTLNRVDLEANPKLKPIRIQAGALAPGIPNQDLLVSRQHRVLVRSAIAERMFGKFEVLIPANKLLALPGIDIECNADGVEYFHMLFDSHQLIWSSGAVTESLFTGPEALNAVSSEARREIENLFPEICEQDFAAVSARYIPKRGKLMKRFVQRHQLNGKPLFAHLQPNGA